jgi:hypothetical protein
MAFCMFEIYLDSNPESCRNKQERYQLSQSSSIDHVYLEEKNELLLRHGAGHLAHKHLDGVRVRLLLYTMTS